ncbi:MAG: hypothetical protein JWN75_737 [Candidatus Saccharibacteria bacterium]|nr:hypothetical protein [Candidatus Saccharibacteria bacterium]
MQIPSDQFKPQINPTDFERGSADVIESIDQVNELNQFAVEKNIELETREDRVTLARKAFDGALWENKVVVETPEQPSIADHMKQLGDISDLIRSYQDQELAK